MVPILSNFMLTAPKEEKIHYVESAELSIQSSHEFIIHPNLVKSTLEKKSEFGILWHIFDNLIMKPYFVYKFSRNNG